MTHTPTTIQTRILHAILPHVAFDGWTQIALDRGAQEVGVMLTNDLKNINQYLDLFCDYLISEMEAHVQSVPTAPLKLHEKIELAVMALFEAATPHREALRKAIAHDAMPTNAAEGTARLYRTVDHIWKAVGDHPTDFSFYTKRLSLAGIYSATLLSWLADDSADHEETRQFLRRRMKDLFAFHRAKKAVQEQVSGLFDRFRRAAG